VRVYGAGMETGSDVTVGTVARLAGISVRTLHHYDEIGLVSPDGHSDAGYRMYSRRNIERLQEVLFFRELGMGLADIRQIIEKPGYTRGTTLESHKEQLIAQSSRLLAMVDLIDRTVNAEQKGINMTSEEMLEVFDGFDPVEYQAEAENRWGGTDAYAQSNRRVSSYTKQDWLNLKGEARALDEKLLALMASGIAADSIEAMDIAEEHRVHITKWFYDCTPQVHVGLGSMYVTDPRFQKNIDKAGEGLAQYLSDAIAANSERSTRG